MILGPEINHSPSAYRGLNSDHVALILSPLLLSLLSSPLMLQPFFFHCPCIHPLLLLLLFTQRIHSVLARPLYVSWHEEVAIQAPWLSLFITVVLYISLPTTSATSGISDNMSIAGVMKDSFCTYESLMSHEGSLETHFG